MPQTPIDRTLQIANALGMTTHIAHDLRTEGYSMEAVAEGMMEGAFFALSHDRDLFLTVLARFRRGYGL